MRLKFVERGLWRAVFALVALTALSLSFAQNANRVIDYMIDNRVSFIPATEALGLNMTEVAHELGYQGVSAWFQAETEMPLIHVECWSFIASLRGSAEDIGLSTEKVEGYFRLRAANDLSFVPECGVSDRRYALALHLSVWTVGDDFPVAHYLDLTGYILPSVEGSSGASVSSSWLGYASATSLELSVRETIQDAVEDIAMTILKVRGMSTRQ